MASEPLNSDFHYYQSANAEVEKIKEDFLVRIHEYEIIVDDIRKNPMKGSVQHFLLLGRRGSGKSTLLKRLEIEISSDPQLSKEFIAINLAEEQANIYKLYDLLEEIIAELNQNGIQVESPDWKDDASVFARSLFESIHSAVEKSGKKLILLLDNIDRIFENLHDDASLLREYLLNYDDIKIIGGSTRMTEHFWKYNKPFYEFFRVLELKPLTSDEMHRLLLNWSNKMNLPELKDFVENKPGQLEMVRLLTDGLPRTLLFFVNILIIRTHETGYEYLRLIMDKVTPLYQERLNNLPPSQRKIILQMAFLWEAVGAKELAQATRMDNKVISAQLKQLAEKGITERIATSTKNNLYRLSERFFNLWLIFTQGSPADKRKARCLTVFLENFYNEEELIYLATKHFLELKEGKLSPNKAALITKALAQSRFISTVLRDLLIDKTIEIENITSDLKHQIPPTMGNIVEEVKELMLKKNYTKALRLAESIEQVNDEYRDWVLGIVYFHSDDFNMAEKYFLKSFNKGVKVNGVSLGEIYLAQGKEELALQYFEEAQKSGHSVNYQIGMACIRQGDFPLADKYFSEEILKNPELSLTIGNSFMSKTHTELGLKYLEIAVNNKIPDSAAELAVFNYLINSNKDLCAELIKKEKTFSDNSSELLLIAELFVNLWSGKLDNIQDNFYSILSNGNWERAKIVIPELLIHFQVNLAHQAFVNSEFSNLLQENLAPIYYVVCLFANKGKDIELQIPPEIKETVDKIIDRIKNRREVYYQFAKE